jgi:hypothetical protein
MQLGANGCHLTEITMGVLQIATKDGGSTEIRMAAVEMLERDLHGSLIFPYSTGYKQPMAPENLRNSWR